MKIITTLILASSLLLVATTSVKADDNFEMPTRYVKMSEKSKAFYQRLQEKQRKAHTTVKTFNNSEIRHQLPLKQEKARNDIYNLGILISQESKGFIQRIDNAYSLENVSDIVNEAQALYKRNYDLFEKIKSTRDKVQVLLASHQDNTDLKNFYAELDDMYEHVYLNESRVEAINRNIQKYN